MAAAATVQGVLFDNVSVGASEFPLRSFGGIVMKSFSETIASTSVDFAADRVDLVPIPQGAKIDHIYYAVTDMDTGGPTIVLDLVIAETTDGTLTETDMGASATMGQAAATEYLFPAVGETWLHEVGQCDDGVAILRMKVATAATTPAAGTLKGYVAYWA